MREEGCVGLVGWRERGRTTAFRSFSSYLLQRECFSAHFCAATYLPYLSLGANRGELPTYRHRRNGYVTAMQAKKSSFGDVPSIVSRVVDRARLLRQLRDVEQPEK